MTVNWQPFVQLVRTCQRFLLTSHIRPDCDCLGSQLGLAAVLEKLGKEVTIVNGQATPPNLAFIDPQHRIGVLGEGRSVEQLIDGFDVLVVLDTSAWAQLGPMGEVVRRTTARKVVIDHHVSRDDLGAVELKDVEAEATGRLVVELAEQLGVPLTAEIATPLFAAIATDTGWFRFSSTTSVTYRVAAKLIDAGAQPAEIYRQLYERDSLARVKLRGLVLSRVALDLDGRLAYTYIRREDFRQTGALPSDTEDLINMVLEVDGTEVAVIFVEQPSGGVKLSFRSRSALDCSQLAEQFGGGGHKAASGAMLDQDFDQARTTVLRAVREAMEASDGSAAQR